MKRCLNCGKDVDIGFFTRYGESIHYYCSVKCFRVVWEEARYWGKKMNIKCACCSKEHLEEGIFTDFEEGTKYFCSLPCLLLDNEIRFLQRLEEDF